MLQGSPLPSTDLPCFEAFTSQTQFFLLHIEASDALLMLLTSISACRSLFSAQLILAKVRRVCNDFLILGDWVSDFKHNSRMITVRVEVTHLPACSGHYSYDSSSRRCIGFLYLATPCATTSTSLVQLHDSRQPILFSCGSKSVLASSASRFITAVCVPRYAVLMLLI